jgi:hypothetical protein
MAGVILFVDDKVHHSFLEGDQIRRSPENELFESLRRNYPVLGVDTLDLAQEAIKSIGSFSAIILDWVFDDTRELKAGLDAEEVKFVRGGDDRTLRFLEDNDFYSLIYVYSTEDIEEQFGERLKGKFPGRIFFQKKPLAHPADEIIKTISDWSAQNQKLSIPLMWTSTINLSIQQIFKELSDADENWVRELGMSAQRDGVSGEIFIIQILQFLLEEMLVQNQTLIKSIGDYLKAEDKQEAPQKDESVARLFRRLLYTKLEAGAALMTGDICDLGGDQFGIIITPECDISDANTGKIPGLELLMFSKSSFDEFLGLAINGKYERAAFAGTGKDKKEKLRKIFNQNDPKYHVLPSFPFDDNTVNLSAAIDFTKGTERYPVEKIKDSRRFKLNSPFIQQLRQRYISHLGRVGVPNLVESLRDFNLRN